MRLDKEQIARYEQDGYVIVEDVLSESELETLRTRTEDIATGRVDVPERILEFEPGTATGERRLESLRKINEGGKFDDVLGAHAHHPVILDIVTDLLGPDIKLYGDQCFVKPPGGIEKTYHQDSPYFTIEPMALVTAWAALDDVTLENGCMYVVPGSQRNGPLEHSEAWMVGGRQDMKIPDSAFDRATEQPITMKAGSVSFHHSLILHRSGPNETPHFRRGYATHYMSARSRWTGAPEDKPQYELVRGFGFEGCV